MNDIKKTPLAFVFDSPSTVRRLQSADITTVGDLHSKSPMDLLKLPRFGIKSLKLVQDLMLELKLPWESTPHQDVKRVHGDSDYFMDLPMLSLVLHVKAKRPMHAWGIEHGVTMQDTKIMLRQAMHGVLAQSKAGNTSCMDIDPFTFFSRGCFDLLIQGPQEKPEKRHYDNTLTLSSPLSSIVSKVKLLNALKMMGVETIGQLVSYRPKYGLMGVPGIGRRSYNEIHKDMKMAGLSFPVRPNEISIIHGVEYPGQHTIEVISIIHFIQNGGTLQQWAKKNDEMLGGVRYILRSMIESLKECMTDDMLNDAQDLDENGFFRGDLFDRVIHDFNHKRTVSRLFLDDERDPVNSDDSVVRNHREFFNYIRLYGCPSFISFDHDLGGIATGLDCAKGLIELDMDHHGEIIPKDFTFYVHSQNPIGAANIRSLLKSYLQKRNG